MQPALNNLPRSQEAQNRGVLRSLIASGPTHQLEVPIGRLGKLSWAHVATRSGTPVPRRKLIMRMECEVLGRGRENARSKECEERSLMIKTLQYAWPRSRRQSW